MSAVTRQNVLRWVERTLLGAGLALAAWCAAALVEARFHNSLPLTRAPEQLVVTQTVIGNLPGDAGATRAVTSPSAGALIGRLDAPSVKMSTAVLEGSDDATLSRGAGHIETLTAALKGKGYAVVRR